MADTRGAAIRARPDLDHPEDDARHGRQATSGRSRTEATVLCSLIHDVIFARRSPSGFCFA
jgi:hypothetical protein